MRSVSDDPDLAGMRHRSQERGSAEEPCWGTDHFQITCTAVLLTHTHTEAEKEGGGSSSKSSRVII